MLDKIETLVPEREPDTRREPEPFMFTPGQEFTILGVDLACTEVLYMASATTLREARDIAIAMAARDDVKDATIDRWIDRDMNIEHHIEVWSRENGRIKREPCVPTKILAALKKRVYKTVRYFDVESPREIARDGHNGKTCKNYRARTVRVMQACNKAGLSGEQMRALFKNAIEQSSREGGVSADIGC